MSDKPWPCRLGFHSLYLDCALIASAFRCNRCDTYRDKHAGQLLERERAALDALPGMPTLADLYQAAARSAIGYEDNV